MTKDDFSQMESPQSSPFSFQIPEVCKKFLRVRGYESEVEIQGLLAPSLKDLTHPFKIDQAEWAAERLVEAFRKNQKICVYGDFDLDGSSGAALFEDGLIQLGFKNLFSFQPARMSEGYGFHAHRVKEFVEEGTQLFITVDVGITALDAVQEANRLGAEVIITDHHLPKNSLPEAHSVLNPNKGTCSSGLGHLCGAGVAFYFLLAIKIKFEEQGLSTSNFHVKSLLDFLAIGTLTDMVPLIKENRVLAKHGLVQMAQTQRPGLKELLSSLGLKGRALSAADVAITMAPKLNALSRMELGLKPLDVLKETDPEKSKELVSEALRINQIRIETQSKAESLAFSLAESQKDQSLIFIWSEEFHKGVIGLVATKVCQTFGKPTFVGSLNTLDQTLSGSGRLPEGSNESLLEFLEDQKEILNRFGGHRQACGFELEGSRAKELLEAFQRIPHTKGAFKNAPENGLQSETKTKLVGDVEVQVLDLNLESVRWLSKLEPFGVGFPVPIFIFRQLQVTGVRPLKDGKHWKLSFLEKSTGARLEALWFSPPANHPVLLIGLELGQVFDLSGEPQVNSFRGRDSVQVIIKDLFFSYSRSLDVPRTDASRQVQHGSENEGMPV